MAGEHLVGDVVIPEVISTAVMQNAAFKSVPLLRSAHVADLSGTPYTDGGDTVTFLTQEFADADKDAEEFAKDMNRTTTDNTTGEKIKLAKYTEAVIDKTIPVVYDYYALRDAARQGDIEGFLGRVIAQSQVETIQRALLGKAALKEASNPGSLEVSLLGETTKTISVDALLDLKLAWGDKVAMFAPGNRPGVYMHSHQFKTLGKTSDYKTLGSAATTAIVQAEAEAGAVASVHGMPIYLLDTVPNQYGLGISGITRSSTTATVTTNKKHRLVVGDVVTITGATQTEYNVTAVVTSVPTATTFTYEVSGTPATPATGSPAFTVNYTALGLLPNALGLLIKEVRVKPPQLTKGSSLEQLDVDFRFVVTRFKTQPKPVVRLVTRG